MLFYRCEIKSGNSPWVLRWTKTISYNLYTYNNYWGTWKPHRTQVKFYQIVRKFFLYLIHNRPRNVTVSTKTTKSLRLHKKGSNSMYNYWYKVTVFNRYKTRTCFDCNVVRFYSLSLMGAIAYSNRSALRTSVSSGMRFSAQCVCFAVKAVFCFTSKAINRCISSIFTVSVPCSECLRCRNKSSEYINL